MHFPEPKRPIGRDRKRQELSRRLAAAAGDGDLAAMKKLVDLGAAINYQNRAGETPLSFAAAWNQPEAAKFLLRLGADPNVPDKTGGTPLMLAAQHGSPELVKLLLKHKADVSAKDKAGNAALAHADWREGDDRDQVRELIHKVSGANQYAKV